MGDLFVILSTNKGSQGVSILNDLNLVIFPIFLFNQDTVYLLNSMSWFIRYGHTELSYSNTCQIWMWFNVFDEHRQKQ